MRRFSSWFFGVVLLSVSASGRPGADPSSSTVQPSAPARPARALIVGLVTDSISRTPMSFCNAIVLGTRIGAQSDGTGMFRLAVLDSGTYQIQVSAVGYQRQRRNVRVTLGGTATLRVRMTRAHLPPGTVLDTTARH